MASLGLSACGPKYETEPVFLAENGRVDVLLRHQVDGGEPVSRALEHPATISDVRVAHILASLSYSSGRGNAVPAIRADQLFDMAIGMQRAFQRATPADEVLVRAYAKDTELQVFSRHFVTAFRAYFELDYLVIEFYALELRLEKNPRTGERSYTIPKQLPDGKMRLRLTPGKAQSRRGDRGLQIAWRDDAFRRTLSFSGVDGRIRRRTILMEDESPDLAPDANAPISVAPDVREAQLNALDDLDAMRRRGEIDEVEFQRRRRLVLEGRIEEGLRAEP
jgi:hypothetical protein